MMDAETRPCDSCKQAISCEARFCMYCGAPVASQQRAIQPEENGENRQLTVMFCDLVNSTALSNRLDAEDLRDMIRTYQEICADAIESHDGTIGQYLGDGVLAYFGYPRASESAAIHATDAALDIINAMLDRGEAMAQRFGVSLSTRVALHTGRVLIGQMGAGQTRDRHALTGATPNLAARLEQIAPINGVAISGQTAALVSRAFEMESLGRHTLKGVPEPVEAFRVLRRRWAVSVLPDHDKPLIAREAELSRMHAAWQRMGSTGNSRLSVVAEPGMGKSSLAAAFLSAIDIPETSVLQVGGTLRDQNTPFACLRRSLEHWTSLGAMHRGQVAQEQIAQWYDVERLSDSPLAQTLYNVLTGTVEKEGRDARARVLEACRDRVEVIPKPMLLVAEDRHWIDPSTVEMLEHLVETVPGVMLLNLSRPVEEEGGGGDPIEADETLFLDRLNSAGCRALIESVAGGPVEGELVRLITSVSGGLPLFIEEFTKSLIESGSVGRVRGVLRPRNLHTKVATPASILDMITVRLDALGMAKSLAQVCAVLGRSFERDALIAVSGEPVGRVDAMLGQLTDAGLLTRDWSGRLTFRHALFQSAAYESLLRAERQKWHAGFLEWLQQRPARLEATPPEIQALHLEACGREREAIDGYMEAGRLAEQASASFEAATHFQKSCDLIALLGQGEEHRALALKAQVKLASALLSARGAGAAETRRAYDKAMEIAEGLPESDWHFPAYWGWWRVSDSFATMAQRGAWLVKKSQAMQGLEFKLQAQHCLWANAFQVGNFDASISSARDGLALYDKGAFEGNATHYGGHDCKVCALGEIGLATWLQGAGDAAVVQVDDAIAHAERLDHLGSLLHALDIAVMLHHYRRDTDAVHRVAERLIALAIKNDLDEYCAKGEIFSGWVAAERGDLRGGLDRIDAGCRVLEQIGTPEDFPVYQCMRADVLGRLGEPEQARAALRKGEDVIAAEGVNYWGAEIARVRAAIGMICPKTPVSAISDSLDQACALARQQGALALELRASLTRCRWRRETGQAVAEAEAALLAVRTRFAADATGNDLAEADAVFATGPAA